MINWSAYPFVKLLFPFITGILLATYFETSDHYFLSAFCCILLIIQFIFYRIRGNIRINYAYWIGIQIGFLIFGYLWTFTKNELNNPLHFQHHVTKYQQAILGTVADMPVKKGEKIKFVLAVKAINNQLRTAAVNGNLLVYLPKDSMSQNLKYGDQIGIHVLLQKIPAPTNPHAFDYQQYLHYKNINYQAFVKDTDWRILGKNKGHPILKTAFQFRNNFIEILRKHLPEGNQFSVGSALILGYKDEITQEIRSAYAGTGAMHVLAVSGLHVGLIFLILNTLLKIFPRQQFSWKVFRVTLLLLGIWSFAILTGGSPSVLRASTMFSFVTIGMNLRQSTNIYNTLAGSAFLLLFYNPFLLMNVGFQMSYLAVIGIVYFQPKIASRWVIQNRLGNYLWQLVAVSIAAQLMTLPLSLYYFHQFPCFFWLSGLIVVPAAGFILAAGLGLFFIETIAPGWGTHLGVCLNGLIYVVNQCIFLIHQIPNSVIQGIWIGGFIAFLLYLLIFCSIGVINTQRWRWVMVGSGLFAFISVNTAFKSFQDDQQQKIIVYDVYKHSLVDLIDGRNCYTLQSQNISEKSISFAAQNNRWEMGITNYEMLPLSKDSLHSFDNLQFKRGRIQFLNQNIAIIDSPINIDTNFQKINVDFLLIQNSPDIEITELILYFNFKKIIFDSSNKRWLVKKWQQVCKEISIPYWYTAEDGAFILEINAK